MFVSRGGAEGAEAIVTSYFTSRFRRHAYDFIVVCHTMDANLGAIPFVSRGGAEGAEAI
jgi:hypothetical protein